MVGWVVERVNVDVLKEEPSGLWRYNNDNELPKDPRLAESCICIVFYYRHRVKDPRGRHAYMLIASNPMSVAVAA
jgi:hypothetical protein